MSRSDSASCTLRSTASRRRNAVAACVASAVITAAATPSPAVAAPLPGAGCGTYFCVTIETGPLAAAPRPAGPSYYADWVGRFARTQSATALPALQSLGAVAFEWRVSVVGHYVAYCAAGVVCDHDAFSDYLGGGVGVPSRDLDVFGLTPDVPRDWDVRVDSPVQFAAYDASGRVVATDRFAAAVILTPEPVTFVLAAAGLAVTGVAVRSRKRG